MLQRLQRLQRLHALPGHGIRWQHGASQPCAARMAGQAAYRHSSTAACRATTSGGGTVLLRQALVQHSDVRVERDAHLIDRIVGTSPSRHRRSAARCSKWERAALSGNEHGQRGMRSKWERARPERECSLRRHARHWPTRPPLRHAHRCTRACTPLTRIHDRFPTRLAHAANLWPFAQFRCRCGRGEPSSGGDVAGVSPVPGQMWQG